jgi:hypothetical protein
MSDDEGGVPLHHVSGITDEARARVEKLNDSLNECVRRGFTIATGILMDPKAHLDALVEAGVLTMAELHSPMYGYYRLPIERPDDE